MSVQQATKTVYRQVVGHFLSSLPSLVTAPGLRVQARPSMATGSAEQGRGLLYRGLSSLCCQPWACSPESLPGPSLLDATLFRGACGRSITTFAGTGQGGPREWGQAEGMPAGLSLLCLISIPCRSVHLPVNTTPLQSQDGQSPSATSLLCLNHPAPLSLPRLRPALLRPLPRARLSAVASSCVVGGSGLWGGGIVWGKHLLNLGNMAPEHRLCTRTDSVMATSEPCTHGHTQAERSTPHTMPH